MLRLGLTEKGVTEILAVSEHVVSITTAAEGLQIPPDVGIPEASRGGLVQPIGAEHEGEAAPTLAEIQVWAHEHLGCASTPAFWRVLAHQSRFLRATWDKDRLIMSRGELDETAKLCTGLAVAMFRQSRYWTSYLTQQLRHTTRMTDAALVELTAGVMHYVSFNTVAHGMRLAAPHTDMAADQFREDLAEQVSAQPL